MKYNNEYTKDTKNIWFPNQREPLYNPKDPNTNAIFKQYWNKEKDRLENGFYLADGKVYISGWLYWHTVYWKIKMKKKKNGRSFPVIETPILRDLEWEAAQNFERALDEGAFIEIVGSRGFGKTVWQSSYAARIYTIQEKSQIVVSGGNAPDIKVVTDKIQEGLLSIHPIWKKKRLRNDWTKEILAGFKTPDGEISEKSSLSQILIRNYQDGNNTMAANGTRPDFHIIDEIGKISNFIKCVKDSDGCWWANEETEQDGSVKPTCLPMFSGTGGDMEVGADAAEMFFKPRANNILCFPDIWEGRNEIGWFVPATKARMEFKYKQTLAKYLGIDHPDLERIDILVSDEEKCFKEWWNPRYQKVLASNNSTSIISFKAYWPLAPSDSFLVLTKNNFNTEAAKKHQSNIYALGKSGTYVDMLDDGEKIYHAHSQKVPITEFPVKSQTKDAPVVIYEFPPENPPFGLYVAGVDPYRQGKAKFSDSLGAVYIFKMMHDIQSEKFQYRLVASYVARPDNPDSWNEQSRRLIKYYNAYTLCENDEMSFINYMIYKGDGHYLSDQPGWLKEIVPNTSVDRPKGIHRSSEKIRDYLNGCVKRYLDEILYKEEDDQGNVVKLILGVVRIPDPMLLEEIIKFNEDEGNYDRIVAFSLALAMAEHLLPKMGKLSTMESDSRIKEYYNRNRKTTSSTVESRLGFSGRSILGTGNRTKRTFKVFT